MDRVLRARPHAIVHILMDAIRTKFCGSDRFLLKHLAHLWPKGWRLHLILIFLDLGYAWLLVIIGWNFECSLISVWLNMHFQNIPSYLSSDFFILLWWRATDIVSNAKIPRCRWERLWRDHYITVVSVCNDTLLRQYYLLRCLNFVRCNGFRDFRYYLQWNNLHILDLDTGLLIDVWRRVKLSFAPLRRLYVLAGQ